MRVEQTQSDHSKLGYPENPATKKNLPIMPTPPTVTDAKDRDTFHQVIKALETQIANVGAHVTVDATTRLAYSREIKAMAKKLENDALAGRISWTDASKQAQETRNLIMEIFRKQSKALWLHSASASFDRNFVKRLPTSEFSIRLLAPPFGGDGMPQSEVFSNGHSTGKVIDGAVLELAVRWRDHILAFVTDNFMHEETLRIYLFDANFEVIDCAWLGSIYATGVFSLIELRPPATVGFRFFGDTDWTLKLLEEENFALPFVEPRGVHRPFKFHRRFKIDGKPKPESR